MDTEKSLIAERAAEWLEQLEQAGPEERARFVKWLRNHRNTDGKYCWLRLPISR